MFKGKRRKLSICLFACLSFYYLGIASAQAALSPIEQLGQFLYFDNNLSGNVEGAVPEGQSCSSCHDPDFGFVDPDSDLPVSAGVIPSKFGDRNSPASAYAMYAPPLYYDDAEELWIGGLFWDGRATGYVLGDPLADQALGPFLNPNEMANISKEEVINDVGNSEYADLFKQVWGAGSLDNVDTAYDQVALSIAAFERTALFAQFSSKYDYYLQACLASGGAMNDCAQGLGKVAGKVAKKIFTIEELKGMQLFMAENNNDGIMTPGEGAMCSACHIAEWTVAAENVIVPAWSPDGSVPPLFTDFTYDNLGVPENTDSPGGISISEAEGLGRTLQLPDTEGGKFKVMTLRNISLTEPYAHNGLFKSLKEITHFYNTRDVPGVLPKGADWPPPQWPATVNHDELGNLGLSDADEDALVEFLKTLSDGYRP